MRLPFSLEQFFALFAQYNESVWPAQVVLLLLAFLAVGLVLRPRRHSGVLVSAILALLWAWLGLAYHLLFFTLINPLAFVFSAVSVLGALAFLWWGVARRHVHFARPTGWRAWAAAVLLIYALAVYPMLTSLSGHHYPASPTFGLPCPTTIFTVGVLAFLARPYPWQLLVVPVLWSAVGVQAAFLLSVPQDLGLLVAGLIGVMLALDSRSGAAHAHSRSAGERKLPANSSSSGGSTRR